MTEFEKAMGDAEYAGIEMFREQKKLGQKPAQWILKVDGKFDENNIQEAVVRYYEAGWQDVQYHKASTATDSHWYILINLDSQNKTHGNKQGKQPRRHNQCC